MLPNFVRLAQAEDFDLFYHWYMHPQINPYLLYEPMEKREFQPIFRELLAQQQLYLFLPNHQPSGMFKLVPLTYRTSHVVYLGGLAIDPAFQGQGYGEKMLAAIVELASFRGFRRIELSVSVENRAAIRLYEKMGFATEGVLRQYCYLRREGRFLDEQFMSLLLPAIA